MQLTKAFALTTLLAAPILALPNLKAKSAPPDGPNGLRGCNCKAWENGFQCYLTPWSPSLPASWGGQQGDFFCASYNYKQKATTPNGEHFYACPGAKGNGDPAKCDDCAQSGSGKTNLCRGEPVCFTDAGGFFSVKANPQARRCKTPGKCPMISEQDMECGRQWWVCEDDPSPSCPKKSGKRDGNETATAAVGEEKRGLASGLVEVEVDDLMES